MLDRLSVRAVGSSAASWHRSPVPPVLSAVWRRCAARPSRRPGGCSGGLFSSCSCGDSPRLFAQPPRMRVHHVPVFPRDADQGQSSRLCQPALQPLLLRPPPLHLYPSLPLLPPPLFLSHFLPLLSFFFFSFFSLF